MYSTCTVVSKIQKGSRAACMLPRPLRSRRPGASQCDWCQASKASWASCRLIWKGTTLGTSAPLWKAVGQSVGLSQRGFQTMLNQAFVPASCRCVICVY